MGIRLNKYLSACGVAARRKSDELIKLGKVKVNNKLIIKPQTIIDESVDIVKFENKILKFQDFVYYKMNKPRFCITSMSDTESKKTILSYLPKSEIKIFPIGRLDYDAEGLLLFTNDGDFAHKIAHPSFKITKTYICHIDGNIALNLLKKMKKGINLDDGFIRPIDIEIIDNKKSETLIKIVISEGRNHIVKNFFKFFNKKVKKLKRVAIGKINLGTLESGKIIKLDYNEIKEYKT